MRYWRVDGLVDRPNGKVSAHEVEGKNVSAVDAIREIAATSGSNDEDDAEDYDDEFAQFLESQRIGQPPPKPVRNQRQSLPSREDPRIQDQD